MVLSISVPQANKFAQVLTKLGIDPTTVLKPEEDYSDVVAEDLETEPTEKPAPVKKVKPQKINVEISPEAVAAAKHFFEVGKIGARWYYQAYDTLKAGFPNEQDRVLFALLLASTSVQNEVYTNFIEAAVTFNAIKKDAAQNRELLTSFVNDENLSLADPKLLTGTSYSALNLFKDMKTVKITQVGAKMGNIKRFLKLYLEGSLDKAMVRTMIGQSVRPSAEMSFDRRDPLIKRLKIANFALTLVDPGFASTERNPFNVVVDTWMFRIFYPENTKQGAHAKGKAFIDKLFGSEVAYANVSSAVSTLAAEAGVSPHYMQAALWTGIKKTWEGESADASNYIASIEQMIKSYGDFWQGMEVDTKNLAAVISRVTPQMAAKAINDRRADRMRKIVATNMARKRAAKAAAAAPPLNEAKERNISGLTMHRQGIQTALRDIINGETSKTEGPIKIWRMESGALQVIDGYHRVVEALVKGSNSIKVKVAGKGYSDYWSEAGGSDVFEINPALPFKGLEKIASQTTLEQLKKRLSSTVDNLQEQVRKPLNIPLPDDLMDISRMFKASGKDFYLVGGAVRDALMGKEPKDLDIATNALPDEVEGILRQNPEYKILEIGKAFGIVKVITPEGNEYEIATFRRDLSGGRRPDAVEFTSIDQDVARRDLTMNALFYDIERQEVVDYVGGIEDIQNGVVRTVGNPAERFDEDRLRILRALRFAGRLGTKLDPATAQAIKDNNSLAGVSPERIRDEFLKGIKSAKSVVYFLNMISEFDLWTQVFPGLRVDTDFAETRDVPVQLALLLRDNGFKEVQNKLNSAKYLGDEVSQVSYLVAFQGLDLQNAYKMKRLFKGSAKLTNEQLMQFAKLAGAPDPKLVKAFVAFEPTVTGAELQAKGLSGKELGTEMERIELERFAKLLGI
jgi:tRNA nucleotidyltransferase/poly(A) polymerase